jgi:glycerate kinase
MKKEKIKIIVAPDSFKGTMSSFVAGNIIKNEIEKKLPNAEVISISVSDGGENTIETFYENFNGTYVEDFFTSPNFERQKFKYVKFKDSAVIEAAQCAGLIFARQKNPMKTTSFGMGEQILHAVSDNNIKKIYIALGGSATNDCGAGMLSALGVKFFDFANKEFIPVGGTLKNIHKIDSSNFKIQNYIETENTAEINKKNINFITMCDVDNVLYGKNGAAYIFAKQKGASENEIILLDKGLKNFSKVVKSQLGIDISTARGGGAAGGIGAACYAFLKAKMQSGINIVLDACNFDEILNDASLAITGEGKFDHQSLMGKAINGIAERTSKRKIPLFVFTGKNEITDKNLLRKYGISKIYQTATPNKTFAEIKKSYETDLRKAVKTFLNELDF